MLKKKVVVLISGRGSNLQAIVQDTRNKDCPYQVVAVISNNPYAEGLEFAENNDITTAILNHKQFALRETFDQQLAKLIDSFQPDIIALAGFMRILSNDFVEYFKGRLINIHPSLLPNFAGLHTHQRAIEAGVSEHGATVHFVITEVDAGQIILQAKVPVLKSDTPEILGARVLEKEHRIYPQALRLLAENKIRFEN
jgi:phosphoribosylglycinamide formyltransferase 1